MSREDAIARRLIGPLAYLSTVLAGMFLLGMIFGDKDLWWLFRASFALAWVLRGAAMVGEAVR